jgi:hypothetical protein
LKTRTTRLLLALGLTLGLFAGAIGTSGAFAPPGDCEPGFGNVIGSPEEVWSYFPAVSNGAADLDGFGPIYDTVTVMNLMDINDPITVQLWVGVGTSADNWEPGEIISLSRNESQTLSADTVGVPEGEVASVVAVGYVTVPEEDDDDDDEDLTCGGEYARIAGVLKSASPVPGSGPNTSAAHMTVDGYPGLTGQQVSNEGFGSFVLPIVQNNSGWDTTVRVANLNDSGNSLTNVTATFYGAGAQGFAGFSTVHNMQIRPGQVESFNISDHVPADWAGSLYLESSADIGAIAHRAKAETDMLITNVSRPESQAANTQYAPLVFQEYNYWNTGISVANLDPNQHNSVTITYYGPTGNQVGTDTMTIPPRGMEFIYTPGTQDLGLISGFVGQARIAGNTDLVAAVDQVKYFGDDPDVGQAISYVTEGPFETEGGQPGNGLVMPLVQKGNPQTGAGDTSGIQLYNTNSGFSVEAEFVLFGANGNPVAPTLQAGNQPAPVNVTLAANGSYTLYTHNLTELSSGFVGSAKFWTPDPGLVGVSNIVNYSVNGDGSVGLNLIRDPWANPPQNSTIPPR